MELNRSEVLTLEPLHRAVVQRHVADIEAIGAGDREAVVLHRHEHALAVAHPYGVIGAAMAEGELEGLEAERETEELVPEADSEQRHPPDKRQHRLDGILELGGIAGAVADEHGLGPQLENRLGIPVARDENDL